MPGSLISRLYARPSRVIFAVGGSLPPAYSPSGFRAPPSAGVGGGVYYHDIPYFQTKGAPRLWSRGGGFDYCAIRSYRAKGAPRLWNCGGGFGYRAIRSYRAKGAPRLWHCLTTKTSWPRTFRTRHSPAHVFFVKMPNMRDNSPFWGVSGGVFVVSGLL
jgi:hypothetical protein